MHRCHRQKFKQALSNLHTAVNANGLIFSEVKGWDHREPVDEASRWAALREVNPKAAEMIWKLTQRRKMTPFENVGKEYKELQKLVAPYMRKLEAERK